MKQRLLVLLAILGLTGWCFGPMLFDGRMPAYRDTADFYYPLFRFELDQWHAGRVPLWNPQSNLGMPLAATGTASVFYPGKLLFHLPLDFDAAFRLYLLVHLLLAAGGAYRLARCGAASVPAAGIAALSYAFCGNVLFQHANVVFLASAAWMPWAMEAALRMIRGQSLPWAVTLGIVMALMVLSGDPQAAYHAGLLAAVGAILLRPPGPQPGGLERLRVAGLLAIAAVVGLSASAIQILPSAEMTARSDRAASDTARSLYEIPRTFGQPDAARRIADGLRCQLQEGTHHERVYRYSVAPWRLAEYVWPNAAGRQFPIHRRWLDAVDGENLVWTPSLYMGLLPLALALAAFRLRRSDPLQAWLSWSVLVAVLASFGRYGLGWLLTQMHGPAGVGEPFGGLYWLLTVVLPGYIEFRYPAKLLVVAALGLSTLAALGWDQITARGSPRLRRCLLGLAVASTLGFVAFFAMRPWWLGWLAGAEPDPLFGPLDLRGAANDILMALAQTAVMALAGCWLVKRAPCARPWAAPAAVILVAVDLAVANGWLVPTTRHVPPLTLAVDVSKGPAPPRVFRPATWIPDAWSATPSPDRLHELACWNRQTAAPHHHLTQGVALVDVSGTMDLNDYGQFSAGLELDAQKRRAVLDLVGVAATVQSAECGMQNEECKVQNAKCKVQIRANPGGLPRAWIVHDVVRLPTVHKNDPIASGRRCVDVLLTNGRPRDFLRQAVVESDSPLASPSAGKTAATPETCRLTHYDPQRVEIDAELSSPGLVVLSDQFYPGWRLTVSTADQPPRETPILRTNRVLRGAWLPAGRHRLVYEYHPTSVLLGATLSALGLVLAGLLVWRSKRARAAR